MNRNKRITQLILDKVSKYTQYISEDVELLLEDRIPALIKKWTGHREVATIPVEAHEIVAGIKPRTQKTPKLHLEHDQDMLVDVSRAMITAKKQDEERLGRTHTQEEARAFQSGGEKHTESVISKIAALDPSPGKQYTDRMLHWFSKSSEPRPFHNSNWNLANSMGITENHKTNMRHAILRSMWKKFDDKLGIGMKRPDLPDVTDEMVDKAFQIHFQQRDATQTAFNEDHTNSSNPFKSEDFGRAQDALEIFHRVKSVLPEEHRDFNKIHSLKHLESIVEPYREYVSASDLKKSNKESIIHDDDDVTVYHVDNQEKACRLGAATRWCVSGRNNNMFDSYNRDGPLIMFVDKKQKMNQFLRVRSDNAEVKSRYKRYMYHPGHDKITKGQFMDENDDEISHDTFISQFPQLKNIPQLQHIHATEFQSDTPSQKIARLQTAQGLRDVMSHMETHSRFHRDEGMAKYLSHHLMKGVNTHEVLADSSNPGEMKMKKVITNQDHGIFKTIFPAKAEDYPTQEPRLKKIRDIVTNDLLQRNIELPRHIAIPTMRETPHMLSRVARVTDDPEVHREAYKIAKEKKYSTRGNIHFDFLHMSSDPKLLEQAYDDANNFRVGQESDHRVQRGEKFGDLSRVDMMPEGRHFPHLHSTMVHRHIAENMSTPDHVLRDMIEKNPVSGVHDDDRELRLDTTTGQFNHGTGSTFGKIGQIALKTLLKKMEMRGGA